MNFSIDIVGIIPYPSLRFGVVWFVILMLVEGVWGEIA